MVRRGDRPDDPRIQCRLSFLLTMKSSSHQSSANHLGMSCMSWRSFSLRLDPNPRFWQVAEGSSSCMQQPLHMRRLSSPHASSQHVFTSGIGRIFRTQTLESVRRAGPFGMPCGVGTGMTAVTVTVTMPTNGRPGWLKQPVVSRIRFSV